MRGDGNIMHPQILKLNDQTYINVSAISHIKASENKIAVHIWFYGDGITGDLVLYDDEEIRVFLNYIESIAFLSGE